MLWYLWILVGFFTGIGFTVLTVAAFAFTVMRKPALQQKYMGALLRSSITRSKKKRSAEVKV